MTLSYIIETLKRSKKIAVSSHTSPDGDAIGSVLSLVLGLMALGKDVKVLSKENIPETYNFLEGYSLFNELNTEVDSETTCVVILDCGNIERINACLSLKDRKYTLINIDHHASNDMYGDLNYTDTNASSVGEIIYQILEIMGAKITKKIAECLYTSILTDTGSFRYSNTTSITHNIAGYLINCGIDVNEIYRNIYENKKLERILLYGAAIQNMKLYSYGKICTISLNDKVFNSVGIEQNTDTSDVITIGMEIDTVEVAVIFKELNDGVKLSFRSKGKVDVRKIAERFGGGGHSKAAGGYMNCKMEEAIHIILKEVEKEL